jgi:AraC family transcriptional regulator, arabinose operon regulatory protein
MDFPAACMERSRENTPHITAAPLVCDEFHHGRNYTNWRPRGTRDWLLIFTLEGAGRIGSEGHAWRLGAGQGLLYRPGTAQDYSTDPTAGRWVLRWAHFVPKPHWQPWLLWPEVAPGTGRVTLTAEAEVRFAEAMNRMIVASRLGGAGATDLAMNALEEAFIWSHRAIAGDRWTHLDPRIQRAVAYLAENPARPFSLETLARHCGLSPSRLSHVFKQQVRTTPRRFSEGLRLDLAEQLLRNTTLNVGEVAAAAGFVDPLYFSRRFARAFGHAPRVARTKPRRS